MHEVLPEKFQILRENIILVGSGLTHQILTILEDHENQLKF